MVYSASMVKALDAGKPATDFFTDQLLYVVFGAACALFLWKVVPYRFWVGPIVWAVWAVAVALIFAVWLAGTDHYGAQRWLYIGPIGLQPSEFCKIAFILVAVRLVVDWWAGLVESRATMVRALIFIIAPIALMYRTQSDLGTTAICFVGILAVMWMGGVSRRVIFACLGVAVLGGLVAIFGTGYRSDRLVFMDPWNDGEGGYGTGYNIIRSYYALAEGGIFGVGLGNSHEKFQYLFASESDFIFAVIGEELGLVGALFVIGLFFCVLYAGLAIAERASDDIGAMIAGGATVMLVFQAFLNIACVIGVFPTTGKPLPFISSGGTSMIASFILVGLVLSVSAAPAAPSVYEQRRADLRLVRRESAPPAPSGRARSGESSRSRLRCLGRGGSGRIDAFARSRPRAHLTVPITGGKLHVGCLFSRRRHRRAYQPRPRPGRRAGKPRLGRALRRHPRRGGVAPRARRRHPVHGLRGLRVRPIASGLPREGRGEDRRLHGQGEKVVRRHQARRRRGLRRVRAFPWPERPRRPACPWCCTSRILWRVWQTSTWPGGPTPSA